MMGCKTKGTILGMITSIVGSLGGYPGYKALTYTLMASFATKKLGRKNVNRLIGYQSSQNEEPLSRAL